MSTSLPLPRGQYNDQKNDLLHGIWNQLSVINGKPLTSLANRTVRGGFGNSTEDLLYQIALELNDFASPLRNRIQGNINPRDFGAVGDGQADDTAAIQAALDYASSANDPGKFVFGSPLRGAGNNVFIPHGYYKVSDELRVKGSVSVFMEHATSYGGTRIVQTATKKHLFRLVADTDGISSGVSFIGGILRAGTAESNPDIALIYGGDDVGDANNNSTYCRNVTFGTPETYAIRIKRGDDVKILDCIFDVSGMKSIGLGGAGPVTNYSIHRCTFYDIRAGVIDLFNAPSGQIKDNEIYPHEGIRIPYFISATNAVSVNNLQVKGNILTGVNILWSSNIVLDNVTIEGNTATDAKGLTISMGGGGVMTRISIHKNTLDGDFSGNVAGQEKSPIFIYGTGLRYSTITENTLFNKNGTLSKPIVFDVTRCELTRCTGNVALGYVTYAELVAGYGYGTAAPSQSAVYVGQEFINATAKTWYKSVATGGGSGDWKTITT